MSDVHEMKTLTLAGEEFNSFPDQQAREEILKKLPLPDGTAKVGQYLRVLSVDEAGKITDVETVDATPGSGGNVDLTDDLKTALINYYTHVMPIFDDANGLAYINAILTALGAETREEPEEPDTPVEPDEPDEPVTPEVTLTSISATYSGGDVAVGTAVTALTGIVVTAHYSDGTSETVTDYTLSGTIAEGSSTVTVTYQSKTATFTVTGVAESGGEDEPGDSTVEIPADATRLAYIESTGTQYIDTGYQPGAKDTVDLTMETAYAGASARVDWFGAYDGTNQFRLGTNLAYVYHGKGNKAVSAPGYAPLFGDSSEPVKFNVKHELTIPVGYTVLSSVMDFYDMDGEFITSSVLGNSTTTVDLPVAANVYLFAYNNNGTVSRHSSMKLYECVFYDGNGAEVHHYVPVKDADNVVCLYDAIDKKYLYNAGTGDFVGGEAV